MWSGVEPCSSTSAHGVAGENGIVGRGMGITGEQGRRTRLENKAGAIFGIVLSAQLCGATRPVPAAHAMRAGDAAHAIHHRRISLLNYCN